MKRSAQQRRELILERLSLDRRVEAAGLADVLDVAVETVRRDLRVLEDHGALVRAHGGAVPVETLVSPRRPVADAASSCLGAAAVEHVPVGGAFVVGAGAHGHALAQQVVDHSGPWHGTRVAATSVDTAILLSHRDDLVVHNLGGGVGADLAQHGPWTLDELAQLRVDVAFLSPDGVDADAGLTMADARASAVAGAIVAAAERVVVLADADAVGRAGFRRFADLADVDVLVVDDAAPESLLATALADLGVTVQRVPVS